MFRGGRGRRDLDERVRLYGLPLLALLATAWLTAGVWGAGEPGGLDTAAHLVRTDFGLREILGRGHLDGWSPTPGVGSELFLFYGPGLAILTGAVRVASLGFLSVPGAFKAVVLGSFLAIPPTIVYLARSFRLSWRASWIAGILALGVSSIYGLGIEGSFVFGLVPHQVAAPVFLFTLGAIVRLWSEPGPVRVVLVALGSSALILTHAISAVILAAMACVVAVLLALDQARGAGIARPDDRRSGRPTSAGAQGRWRRRIGRSRTIATAAAASLTASLVAFWLLPFLAHLDLGGAVSSWVTPTIGVRLGEVLDGRSLFRPKVAWFVAAGMLGLLLQAKRKTGPNLTLALAPIVYLLAAHLVQRRLPFNDLAFHLPNRGLGYAGLLAVLPLAVVLDQLGHRLRQHGTVVVAGVAIAIGVWPVTPLRHLARDTTASPATQEAARQLRQRVPAHARFAFERHLDEAATGLPSPPFSLALMSGRHTVNAFAPETSTATDPMFIGNSMTSQPPEEAADRLVRYGVTHVVMTSDEGRARLAGSPRFFPVWAEAPLSILEVQAPAGRPPASSLVSTDGTAAALLLRGDPERVLVRVGAPQPVMATLAWPGRPSGGPSSTGSG